MSHCHRHKGCNPTTSEICSSSRTMRNKDVIDWHLLRLKDSYFRPGRSSPAAVCHLFTFLLFLLLPFSKWYCVIPIHIIQMPSYIFMVGVRRNRKEWSVREASFFFTPTSLVVEIYAMQCLNSDRLQQMIELPYRRRQKQRDFLIGSHPRLAKIPLLLQNWIRSFKKTLWTICMCAH